MSIEEIKESPDDILKNSSQGSKMREEFKKISSFKKARARSATHKESKAIKKFSRNSPIKNISK